MQVRRNNSTLSEIPAPHSHTTCMVHLRARFLRATVAPIARAGAKAQRNISRFAMHLSGNLRQRAQRRGWNADCRFILIIGQANYTNAATAPNTTETPATPVPMSALAVIPPGSFSFIRLSHFFNKDTAFGFSTFASSIS
jgi:hypothetical protein